jgi:hypothetical protein
MSQRLVQEFAMSASISTSIRTSTSTRSLPDAVLLWSPPHQRLLAAAADAWGSIRQAWARGAERRAARRDARELQSALSGLDARGLRDLGLGDWMAASALSSEDPVSRRQLELRGW